MTEADIEAQEAVVEKIRERFPDDGYLGEEEHLEPENEDRVWIVDPLDGTFNFENSCPFYCVSIALEVNGELKVGVISSPESSLGKTFLAIEGCGAYAMENGEIDNVTSISVSDKDSIKDSLFFITTFEIYEGEFERERQVFTELVERDAVQRQLGACAVEMCFIASGKVDSQIDPIAKKWDYAAGKIIIEEAGGEVRVRESCFPDSYEIVASNGEFQGELEELVGERFQ